MKTEERFENGDVVIGFGNCGDIKYYFIGRIRDDSNQYELEIRADMWKARPGQNRNWIGGGIGIGAMTANCEDIILLIDNKSYTEKAHIELVKIIRTGRCQIK